MFGAQVSILKLSPQILNRVSKATNQNSYKLNLSKVRLPMEVHQLNPLTVQVSINLAQAKVLAATLGKRLPQKGGRNTPPKIPKVQKILKHQIIQRNLNQKFLQQQVSQFLRNPQDIQEGKGGHLGSFGKHQLQEQNQSK